MFSGKQVDSQYGLIVGYGIQRKRSMDGFKFGEEDWKAFLVAPLSGLLDLPVHEMNDQQLREHIIKLRTRNEQRPRAQPKAQAKKQVKTKSKNKQKYNILND